MPQLPRSDTEDNEAHKPHSETEAHAQGIKQTPLGLIPLINEEKVGATDQAGHQGHHEDDDKYLEHSDTRARLAPQYNGLLSRLLAAVNPPLTTTHT